VPDNKNDNKFMAMLERRGIVLPDAKSDNKFIAMLERTGLVRKSDSDDKLSEGGSKRSKQKNQQQNLPGMGSSVGTPAARQPIPGMPKPIIPDRQSGDAAVSPPEPDGLTQTASYDPYSPIGRDLSFDAPAYEPPPLVPPPPYEEPAQYEEPPQYEVPVPYEEPTQYEEAPQYEEPAQYEEPTGYGEPPQTEEAAQYEEPTEYEEPPQTEEAAQYEEPTEYEEPAPTEETAQDEEPTQYEEPAEYEEPAPTEETAQDEEPAPTEETAQYEEPVEYEEPAQPEETAQYEEPVQYEETAQYEEPTQYEEPAMYEQPVQFEPPPPPKYEPPPTYQPPPSYDPPQPYQPLRNTGLGTSDTQRGGYSGYDDSEIIGKPYFVKPPEPLTPPPPPPPPAPAAAPQPLQPTPADYTDRYLEVDELFEVLSIRAKKTETVYLIEEYLNTLPASLPDASRRQIVNKLIDASDFDFDRLLGDGILRVKMLKEYAERFAKHTNDYVAACQAELDEHERHIERIRLQISARKDLHKKQFFAIEAEAQRLKDILTFISG
jgi:chemotaxis protein histidine kinase CheA